MSRSSPQGFGLTAGLLVLARAAPQPRVLHDVQGSSAPPRGSRPLLRFETATVLTFACTPASDGADESCGDDASGRIGPVDAATDDRIHSERPIVRPTGARRQRSRGGRSRDWPRSSGGACAADGRPRDRRGQPRPIPGNTRIEQWPTQDDVLQQAAVVVGHGASGITLGALAAVRLLKPVRRVRFAAARSSHGSRAAHPRSACLERRAIGKGKRMSAQWRFP
jgi:hypothetical protein